MIGLDYTKGPAMLTHRATSPHQSPMRPSQTVSYSDRSFAAHLPPPINHPVLSVWAGFPQPKTRPNFPTNLWQATYRVADFPMLSFVQAPMSIDPSNWYGIHCTKNFVPARCCPSVTSRSSLGRLPRVWYQSRDLKPNVVPPSCDVASLVLWTEKGD